jgi:hypothetical protein
MASIPQGPPKVPLFVHAKHNICQRQASRSPLSAENCAYLVLSPQTQRRRLRVSQRNPKYVGHAVSLMICRDNFLFPGPGRGEKRMGFSDLNHIPPITQRVRIDPRFLRQKKLLHTYICIWGLPFFGIRGRTRPWVGIRVVDRRNLVGMRRWAGKVARLKSGHRSAEDVWDRRTLDTI